MAVLGINYTGCNHEFDDNDERIEVIDPKRKLKYKSVYLHHGNKKKYFKSGNFVKDWYDAKKYYLTKVENEHLSASSTVDHFIMDGAKFDSAYLHVEGEKYSLKYVDRTEKDWFMSDICDGWEFFVTEGTKPTWEELRIICGDIKQKK